MMKEKLLVYVVKPFYIEKKLKRPNSHVKKINQFFFINIGTQKKRIKLEKIEIELRI